MIINLLKKYYDEIYTFIRLFREKSDDDIVIYTGYKGSEIIDKLELLSNFKNIIVKLGRYKSNEQSHFDEVLGVNLASNNQYAIRVSQGE